MDGAKHGWGQHARGRGQPRERQHMGGENPPPATRGGATYAGQTGGPSFEYTGPFSGPRVDHKTKEHLQYSIWMAHSDELALLNFL